MSVLGCTYLFASDLPAMKYFYDEILGLHRIWDEEDVIAFDIAGHQLSVT